MSAAVGIDSDELFLFCSPHPQLLGLRQTGLDIADVFSSEHGFPMLEHLSFGTDDAPAQRVPAAIFRPQLRYLAMGNIRGPLPDNMGCMANLTRLLIEYSEIPTLPDSLGELRSLEVLELEQCGLTALPAGLAGLSRLRALAVSFSPLRSFPPLGALRRLTSLYLECNELTALPEGVADLPLLKARDIYM